MTFTRTVVAFNTATASDNKIHDDGVANRFGFTGGLVPGVDVFAYLAHAPVELWGHDFLTGGRLRARFGKPVYDGDEATTTATPTDDGALALSIAARGVECATGTAWRHVDAAAPPILPFAMRGPTETRPKASFQSLVPGAALGTLVETYLMEPGRAHLDAVREEPALFDGGRITNPAWLLRRANYVLAYNVKLGPWIHVESDMRLHGLVVDGDAIETRAVVAENVESKGHLIVTLDFTISSHDRLAASGRHWAIYEPRQVREKVA
jgi:acyl dehydratase